MTQNALLNDTTRVKSFINQLVKDNYRLNDKSTFQLIFDSDLKIPYLKNIRNQAYKVNCMINILVSELNKLGRNINYTKIKDDFVNRDSKKKALVYQVLAYEEDTRKLVDYYFIFDTQLIKLFCFKRDTDFSKENKRLIKVISYLYNQLYKDHEEVYKILKENGFSVTVEEVYHLIKEFL